MSNAMYNHYVELASKATDTNTKLMWMAEARKQLVRSIEGKYNPEDTSNLFEHLYGDKPENNDKPEKPKRKTKGTK